MNKFLFILCAILFFTEHASSQTPEVVVPRGAAGLSSSTGKVFFLNQDTVWMSDGTAAGTQAVKELPFGKVRQFVECNGKTYFSGPESFDVYELWVTDGTESGTVIVKDINPTNSGCIDIFQAFNNKLYFLGDDGVNGQELWATDGTEAGTTMIKDINPGISNGVEAWAQSEIYSGKLYFSANDGVHGEELWATDGTEAGTVMVKDIHPTGSSTPGYFTIVNNQLYFRASDNTNGNELWTTDGTGGGTVLVKDINPGAGSSFLSDMIAYNGNLYFSISSGFDFNAPNDLWQSDGTSGGTAVFEDSASSQYVYNGHLYFNKIKEPNASVFENALYKTDGTPSGTVKVKDLVGGKSKSSAYGFTEAGGKLYFLCSYDSTGGGALLFLDNDLWVTDGTSANTQLVRHASNELVNVFVNSTNIIENEGSFYFTDDNNLYKIAGSSTGIQNISAKEIEVFVSPNPSNSLLNIQTKETIETISIYDVAGALVQTETQPVFSIAQLQPGVYLVHVKTEKGVATVQMVKE